MQHPFLAVAEGVLTEFQCSRFRGMFLKERCFRIDNGVATYNRILIIDPQLAQEIFEKVRHLVPSSMHVVRANDHIRLSEYEEGGEFKIHKDGIHQDQYGDRSVVTVNVFLNDGFEGGSTDFFESFHGPLRLSVLPKVGRAAVFDSQQYHCGRPVKTGRKYLLRTDLMGSMQ